MNTDKVTVNRYYSVLEGMLQTVNDVTVALFNTNPTWEPVAKLGTFIITMILYAFCLEVSIPSNSILIF